MKGLLIKDFCLLKMQKKFFILIIIMSICLAVSMDDTSFIIGYLTIVMPSFSISTISYDEFDKGNSFLFTLPISRKGYVIEKYCFSFLLGIASLIISIILSLCVGMVKGMPVGLEHIKFALPFFPVMVFILSIMIPLQLKFGAEKSRIAIFAFAGISFVIGFGAVKIFEVLKLDLNVMLDGLFSINAGILIAIAVAIVLVVFMLSMKISISIMNKKEF